MNTAPSPFFSRRQALRRLATALAAIPAAQSVSSLSAHEEGRSSDAKVTPLFSQSIAARGESDVHMVLVEYAGGGTSKPHQHSGPVFVYVLEGAFELQITGGPLTTVRKGETFYEPAGAVHLVSRNASATEPARLLAVIIGDKGVPPTRAPDKA